MRYDEENQLFRSSLDLSDHDDKYEIRRRSEIMSRKAIVI